MSAGTKKPEKIDKKAEKASTVEAITARLKESSTAVLADYRGMTVAQMQDLRSKLRSSGIEMMVVKNTLARRAAKAAGYAPLRLSRISRASCRRRCPSSPVRSTPSARKKNRKHRPERKQRRPRVKGGIEWQRYRSTILSRR